MKRIILLLVSLISFFANAQTHNDVSRTGQVTGEQGYVLPPLSDYAPGYTTIWTGSAWSARPSGTGFSILSTSGTWPASASGDTIRIPSSVPWANITGEPTFLTSANNLSDVTNAAAARTNLGAESVTNKVTNLSSPDNTTYPTTDAVSNALTTKQFNISLTTTGTGAATFNSGTATINIPTPTTSSLGAENIANKATSLSSPNNTTYPTTQAVATALAGKMPVSDTSYLVNYNLCPYKTAPLNSSSILIGSSIINAYIASTGGSFTTGSYASKSAFYSTGAAVTNLSINGSAGRAACRQLASNLGLTSVPIFGDWYINGVRVTSSTKKFAYRTQEATIRNIGVQNWKLPNPVIPYTGTSATLNSNITLSNPSGWTNISSSSSLSDYGSRSVWYRTNQPSTNSAASFIYKSSIVANETMTISNLRGNNIGISTWAANGTTQIWSRISVSVDGIFKTTFNPNVGATFAFPGVDGGTTVGIISDAIVITGLADTTHTVILTFLDAGTISGIDYITGLISAYASTYSPIYLSDAYHMSNGAGIGYNTSGLITTQAVTDSATLHMDSVATNSFPGFAWSFVHINKYLNTSTQLQFDGIHPSESAQASMVQAYIDNLALPTPSNSSASLGLISTGYIPVVASTTALGNSIIQQNIVAGSNNILVSGVNLPSLVLQDASIGAANSVLFGNYQGGVLVWSNYDYAGHVKNAGLTVPGINIANGNATSTINFAVPVANGVAPSVFDFTMNAVTGFSPTINNLKPLGTTSLRYSNVFSVLGNFSGALTCSSSITSSGTITGLNHYSTSLVPTITAGAGLGTSPTIAITGTNDEHVITLTTGTLPTAGGVLFTVTMSGGFNYPNSCNPILDPTGTNIYGVLGTLGKGTVNNTSYQYTGTLTAATSYVLAIHNGGR